MRTTRFWLAGAAALGLALAGCGDDAGGGGAPDAGDGGSDTDSDSDWDYPLDGSVWGDQDTDDGEVEPDCECADPLCGIEYTCAPGVKECLCDTVCSVEGYEPIGWAPYLETFRCYAPCGDGGECARDEDVCTHLPGLTTVELCVPRIQAESGEFDIKVLPEGAEFSAVDMAQVDIQLLVGGEEIHLVNGFAYGDGWGGEYGMIDLVFMEPGVGDEYYYLAVYVFQDYWAPGTVELGAGAYELDGRLYRISDEMWVAGLPLTGTIELLETTAPELCDGPGCPKTIIGAMSLELYGLEAKFPED
jgi:hypothetical protein